MAKNIDLRSSGSILLVSCYELGHQPLSLASPLGKLQQAGYAPVAVDTSVEELTDATIASARLVAISVPMHTALRLGTRVAERVRDVNATAHICFYGLYASLNASYLLSAHADSVIGGEYEEALLALARALETSGSEDGALLRASAAVPGVHTREHSSAPVLARLPFARPERATLPPIQRYARLVRGREMRLAGYVEASHGCLHTCAHCPITPVYNGRFFVIPKSIVLDDIRAQVDAGARHITFGDPDFLNGPRHSMEIVRRLHADFPEVTFDATIKVEHILKHRELFPELASLNCAFVVSAVESLSAEVLRHLAKGHTRRDVEEAVRILHDAGIPMRPTFVAFTPWTTARDYIDLLDFILEYDMIEHIDPIQFAIRLLVPPGSAMLNDTPASWLGALDAASFTYKWVHPDPRMDILHTTVSALVEHTARTKQDDATTFMQIYRTAGETLHEPLHSLASHPAFRDVRSTTKPVPHLSEPWFC